MSVDLKLVKELRDRTSLGMNDCKRALEEADSDINTAIDLLKKWGELKGAEKASKVATEGTVVIYGTNSNTMVGIAEVNCQTDFLAKSKEFQQLLLSFSKTFDSDKFEYERKELIAKSGENIVLSRKEEWFSRTISEKEYPYIGVYVHPGSKLGVIVEGVSTIHNNSVAEFMDDIAMQIAAMSPIAVSKEDISLNVISRQQKIFEAQLAEEKKPEHVWSKILDGKFSKWRKDIVLLEQDSIKEQNKTVDQLRRELNVKLGAEITIKRFVRYAVGESNLLETE